MNKSILILLLGLTTLLISCSDDSSDSSNESSVHKDEKPAVETRQPANKYIPEGGASRFADQGYTEQQISDLLAIEAGMTDALIRWSYRDKGGLYENEFEYIQDRFTFDQYLVQKLIERANGSDSVVGCYVESGQFFERDSIYIDEVVIFIGSAGNRIDFRTKDRLYFHRNRWIRPSIGKIDEQVAYEKVIRAADSAAAAEENESY